MNVGHWYMQAFPDRTLYFIPSKDLKHGGWAGVLVTVDETSRAKPRAKSYSIRTGPYGSAAHWSVHWRSVPRSEVPERVIEASRADQRDPRLARRRGSRDEAPPARLRWTRPGPHVWVSEPTTVMTRDAYGSMRTHHVKFRVDGRNKAREGYRVDRASLFGWEAIDRMQGAKTLAEGKKLAAAWLDAARAGATLDPRSASYGRDARRRLRDPRDRGWWKHPRLHRRAAKLGLERHPRKRVVRRRVR